MKKCYPLFFIMFLATSLSAQVTWENFEDSRKGTYGFISGTFIPYNENPDKTGANTSLVAASYTRNPAEAFDVLILDAHMADLTDYVEGTKQMSIDVWSPTAGTTVQITLENDTLALPANFPTGRHSVYLATTSVEMGWETLTFTFDNQPDGSIPNDLVNRLVLLFDPGNNTGDTYFWDNLNGPELANDPCEGVTPDPEIFNDFECNQQTNFLFSHSGVNFRRILNPDSSGINTSGYVAQYVRNAAETFDVIIAKFNGNLMLQPNSTLAIDVWDPNAPTDIILSLQNDNSDVILEMRETTSESGMWETITFNPSAVAAATDISQFVILFDPDTNTSDQYFFDNFEFGLPLSVADLDEVLSFEASPNPSQGITRFQYELNNAANIQLTIYDLTGKLVTTIADEYQTAGSHQYTWDAEQVANGIYFYTMNIDGQIATGKIVLNK